MDARRIALATTALLLMAVSAPASGAEPGDAAAGEPFVEPLSVDDIHWPYIESYCAFLREGQAFDYNDFETWRFVFFTGFPQDPDGVMPAYMRINGVLRELVVESGSFEAHQISYRVPGDADLAVALSLKAGEKGYESTAYSGTLRVTRGAESVETGFSGDCGV